MANTFTEKAQRYVAVLDEIYAKESLTAILEQPNTEFVGAGKVRYPKIAVDGAADYDRANGYADGSIKVEWEEHVLEHDRARKFRIDAVDNDEQSFDLYRVAANEYIRTKEIPEIDAARFARMAGKTGAKVVEADLAANTDALALFDEAEQYLLDTEVSMSDVVLYVSAAFYRAMKQSAQLSRRLDVSANNGDVNRSITMLDGQTPVIVVPKNRFYTAIQLLDGKSSGEEAGGFKPVSGTSKAINFLAVPKPFCKAITKRKAEKVIAPEVNQSADAYDVMYRCHHDLIVPTNKEAGIYAHVAATAYAE